MKLTDWLWEESSPIYKQIIAHPFNQELMNGTLAIEKFKQYIFQDSLYLADFARALSLVAARANEVEHVLQFAKFAEGAIVVERALHSHYFSVFNIEHQGQKSPACFAYTHYLLSTCGLKNLEEAVAALLPCFWIYKEVGDHILAHQRRPNTYQQWIDTYASPEFAELVEQIKLICDELGQAASPDLRHRMRDAYLNAARLEWLFWDSAHRLEQWPV